MNLNFRLGPFRLEVSPKPRVVLDVRKVVASEKKKPVKRK